MNVFAPFPAAWTQEMSSIDTNIAEARHLPGEVYTSPEIAAEEKARIWMTHWLCVGRQEEIPNVGDYLTTKIAGEPIVVARGNEGVVAYLNMCLHRGVEVAFGRGNPNEFQCPYHSWSYDVTGKLQGAPFMKGTTADLSNCRMPTIKTALWRGWIYVNFDKNSMSFEEFIAPYETVMPYYRTGEARLARKLELDVKCNWKCVAENLLDWYHASTVHAGTFGKYYKFGKDPLKADLLPNGGSSVQFDSSMRTVDPNLPFPQLPWVAATGASIYTAKAAMFPNMNCSSQQDSLRMWTIWPTSTDTCHVTCYVLLPEISFQVPDFEAKLDKYCDYLTAIALEDQQALKSLQRVAASDKFKPGALSQLEIQLHHLLRHYVDVMSPQSATAR